MITRYADDISIHASHTTEDIDAVQDSLQRDLDNVDEYAKQWAIQFNTTQNCPSNIQSQIAFNGSDTTYNLRRTRKNTSNCIFFLGFRSPSLYFCYLLYLKLNGKIASLDKAITVENIGLFNSGGSSIEADKCGPLAAAMRF